MSRVFFDQLNTRLADLKIFQASILDAAKQVQRDVRETIRTPNGSGFKRPRKTKDGSE